MTALDKDSEEYRRVVAMLDHNFPGRPGELRNPYEIRETEHGSRIHVVDTLTGISLCGRDSSWLDPDLAGFVCSICEQRTPDVSIPNEVDPATEVTGSDRAPLREN